MAQALAAIVKIPTTIPQPVPDRPAKTPVAVPATRAKKTSGPRRGPVFASGSGRAARWGGGEVIELECGVTIYPARPDGGRWRAKAHLANRLHDPRPDAAHRPPRPGLFASIALRVGFKDASPFSRAFKTRYGTSPATYRSTAVTARPGSA